jgi:ABC-type nitrate/sulfonate/bicarbonate transport system substrate-binding protein
MRADTAERSKAQTRFYRQGPAFLLLTWLALVGVLVTACAGSVAAPSAEPVDEAIVVYAPATPSSIPVIVAAEEMPEVELTIFTDHSQAQALFLRGDVDLLVTGLAVGVAFFEDGVPVTLLNSYVSGLTYLVTRGQPVGRFDGLAAPEVYLPFEGSPIDEVTRFFVESEGLTWGEDVVPVYSPFPASVELLRQGRASAVALPEPFVSLVEGEEEIFVSLSYEERWETLTGSGDGYPQVGTFAREDWAREHSEVIAAFNRHIEEAVEGIREEPADAVDVAAEELAFPAPVLRSALERTSFAPRYGAELEGDVRDYYRAIGAPLEEDYATFFYGDQE